MIFPKFDQTEESDEKFENSMISLTKLIKTKSYSVLNVYKTEAIHALLRMMKNPENGLISLSSKNVRMIPEFSPGISHYQADRKVAYEEINVEFNVSFRKSFIKFDDSEAFTGSSKVLTFTLGLGSNRILLPVYDFQNKNRLKTYSIDIIRENRQQTGNPKRILQSCDFYQDCQMPVLIAVHRCGLQNATEYSCLEHGIGGRWRVPCERCSSQPEVSDNCEWKFAQWLPNRCEKHRQESAEYSCLSGWKLIFVGDSTNRGIFHRTVELLNGTLTDGAKTHDATVLELSRNIHAEFHYYPKFWIDQPERPTFETVIENLKIHNRTEKVALVVGGAQWLDLKHVFFLQSYKER